MKKLFVLTAILISGVLAHAQDEARTIPSINVKDLQGGTFNTGDLENDGKPMVINFWATWCSPCKRELNNIAEVYDDWVEETGVKLIAISIDDARNMGKVAPYVNGKGWEYEVYIDPNGDFKRALGVNNVPHTFIVNGEGEIVWQHNGYAEGGEDEILEVLNKLNAGEDISH